MWDIDKARMSEHNRIWLDIDRGPLVTGFVSDDIQWGLGNHWEAPFLNIGNAASAMAQALNQGANMGGAGMEQLIVRNLTQTVSQWTGSERFSITLNLVFPATDPDDDVRVPVSILSRMVLPAGSIADLGVMGFTLRAPNNFRATGLNSAQSVGGIGIAIGNWFATPQMFVVRQMNPLFSKTPTRSGRPLFAIVSIALETYRMVVADEVVDFFPNMPASGGKYAREGNMFGIDYSLKGS